MQLSIHNVFHNHKCGYLINKMGLYLKQKLLLLVKKIKILAYKAILHAHKKFSKGKILVRCILPIKKCNFRI